MERMLQFVIGSVDWSRKVSIPTKAIAQAMINCTLHATSDGPAVNILDNQTILNLSKNNEN